MQLINNGIFYYFLASFKIAIRKLSMKWKESLANQQLSYFYFKYINDERTLLKEFTKHSLNAFFPFHIQNSAVLIMVQKYVF